VTTQRPVLPTFLVIGTNKAGTTSLYASLAKHPEIFLPYKKELHFFNSDPDYAKGLDAYAELFAGAAGFRARGDITPAYLYWGDKVIPRIEEVYGDEPPRMVVILRDPVERAYSRYWHRRRVDGREPLSFEDALAAEERRLLEDAPSLGVRGRFPRAYFRGGLYGEQLERYFSHFPRECFHVMLFEDLRRDFVATARGLLTFLGVDADVPVVPAHENPASRMRAPKLEAWLRSRSSVARVARRALPDRMRSRVYRAVQRVFLTPLSYPPMNAVTEDALRRRYLPDIRKLEALIARDLPDWYPKATRPDAAGWRQPR
jgi:Sulfotransferase domain